VLKYFSLIVFYGLQAFAAGPPSELDFSIFGKYIQYPQRKITEVQQELIGNWVYNYADWKFQTKVFALGQQQTNNVYRNNYIDCLECYGQWSQGINSVKIGTQDIHWGLTDGYNPLDRVNSKIYYKPLLPQERGELMLNYSFTGAEQQVQFLFIPKHKKPLLPDENSVWLPRQIPMNPGDNSVIVRMPEAFQYRYGTRETLNNADENNIGLQWHMQKGDVETTLNYFEGLSAFPLLVPNVTGNIVAIFPSTIVEANKDLDITVRDYKVRSIGGSFLWNLDSFLLKWEGVSTESLGTDRQLPGKQFEQVAAFEKNWNVGKSGLLTSIVQFSHVGSTESSSAKALSVQGFFEQTAMLGLRYNWQEKWTLTTFSAQQTKNKSALNEIELIYDINEFAQISLQSVFMDGPDDSLMGVWRENDFYAIWAKVIF
jgi:hypothetical protein